MPGLVPAARAARLAAELGADSRTGADARDRADGSSGDDGRVRPVAGMRLMAAAQRMSFLGPCALLGEGGALQRQRLQLRRGAQCRCCARSLGGRWGVCVLL